MSETVAPGKGFTTKQLSWSETLILAPIIFLIRESPAITVVAFRREDSAAAESLGGDGDNGALTAARS